MRSKGRPGQPGSLLCEAAEDIGVTTARLTRQQAEVRSPESVRPRTGTQWRRPVDDLLLQGLLVLVQQRLCDGTPDPGSRRHDRHGGELNQRSGHSQTGDHGPGHQRRLAVGVQCGGGHAVRGSQVNPRQRREWCS